MFQQGDSIRFWESSVGKQWVANSVMAIRYATFLTVEDWRSNDVDSILVNGDKLYSKIDTSYDFKLISDIPDIITQYGGAYEKVKVKENLEQLQECHVH